MKNEIQMNGFKVCLLNEFLVQDERKRIVLRNTRNYKGIVYPLKDNSQFIFDDKDETIRFGGMDEQHLFLTELQKKPFDIFKRKGEAAFYDSLVPKVIKKWSEKIGVSYGRQGDWFFIPLRIEKKWDLVKLALNIKMHHPWARSRLRKSEYGIYEYAKTLLNSRHKLEIMSNSEKYQIIEFPWRMFVALGALSAPNHKTVVLEEPNLLAQSNYLINPQEAD